MSTATTVARIVANGRSYERIRKLPFSRMAGFMQSVGAGIPLMESWAIALISAVASGSITVIGAVYWFGRNTVTISDLHELRDLAIEHRDELKNELASERRDVGEGLLALREKINQVELYGSKNYVRRESWHQAMNQLQETFGKGDAAAEQRMLRLEEKIDRLSDRIAYRPQGM